jgi:hypothetical protein
MITLQLQERYLNDDDPDDPDSNYWTDWYLLKEYKPIYRSEEGEIKAAVQDLTTLTLNLSKIQNHQYRLVWVKSEVIDEIKLPTVYPKG